MVYPYLSFLWDYLAHLCILCYNIYDMILETENRNAYFLRQALETLDR